MIDAIYKRRLDRFWDRLGAVAARTGLTANAVTLAGLALGVANALWFVQHRNTLVFGLCLAVIELLDNLDGAVARVTGSSTRAGSFLDAWTDRYKELIPLLAIAHVTGEWLVCFLAVTGSLMVSYSHARAAMEGADGSGCAPRVPDLFERFERVGLLCIGLVCSPLLPAELAFGRDLLFLVLCLLAVMTHLTALQRFWRGWRLLRAADR